MDLFNKKLYLPEMISDGIKRGQDNVFITYQKANGQRENITYNDLNEQTNNLILKLKKAGLKKGDRIAIISALRPYWFSLYYACLQEEYLMVCIDPGTPIVQMQNMLIETQVRAVFTSLSTIHLPNELKGFIPIFSIELDFPLISKCEKVNYLLSESLPLKEGTFFILFSSGTTGERRKAVLLKQDTLTLGIEYGMSKDSKVYKKTSAYTPRECDLMLFPPYHIAGLLCLTYDLYCNTNIIILERITPNGLMKVFSELKPDNICTVPSMLDSLYKKIVAEYSKKLLNRIAINSLIKFSGLLRKYLGIKAGRILLKPLNKKAFGGNMKGFMIGASPFDVKPNKFFLDMGIDVSMAYGLTELGAPLTCSGQGYYPATAGRVVRHTKDIDIRIVNVDENGRGEVEVKSPYQMISYLHKEDNEDCFTYDGYFKTGDLGYFDKKKCLVICGRIKESIVLKNGEKLLPEEIESKYQGMNCVKDVVAFKVPGEGGCDDFAIAITNDKSMGIQDSAIKVRVYERAQNLPQMYRPKDVYLVTELPYSSSHKVQRFRLTQMVLDGESEPITDSSMIIVDEDKTTAELRKMLIRVAGPHWKTAKLTQGLLLNIDSLSTVNLYVAIQEKWGIDLFQTASQPETFGELLDTIKNFDAIDKNNKNDLDLSKYPMPSNSFNDFTAAGLELLAKNIYHVKSNGIENLPTDTNYLICSNHRTDIDFMFISSVMSKEIMKNTCIVGKDSITTNKLLNTLGASLNFIPVDRTGNTILTLNRCQELLLEGKNILIFPEGTSVQNHTKVFPLKEGSARLSIVTNKPIVPVSITGVAYQEKEMNQFRLPKFESRILVKFGKPIYPNNLTPQELNQILTKAIDEL